MGLVVGVAGVGVELGVGDTSEVAQCNIFSVSFQ